MALMERRILFPVTRRVVVLQQEQQERLRLFTMCARGCPTTTTTTSSTTTTRTIQWRFTTSSVGIPTIKEGTHCSSHSFSPQAKISSDGVKGEPIDFDVSAKIEGNESQIVIITLEPGQVLRAESGAMMYMTEGIQMSTTTGGGITAGMKRMLTGQNMFISDYTYEGPSRGQVALGTAFPSKIIRLNIHDYGGKVVCQKGALLCASHTIDIAMEFTKTMTGGFFGGEGFILQALTGEGEVFVKAGGTLIRRELEAGEDLRISSGSLVAFSQGVDYDVQFMKGIQNTLFSGEGLFLTTLKGPGTVWLQGQPPERMIGEISSRVPSGGAIGIIPVVGMGGTGGGSSTGGR